MAKLIVMDSRSKSEIDKVNLDSILDATLLHHIAPNIVYKYGLVIEDRRHGKKKIIGFGSFAEARNFCKESGLKFHYTRSEVHNH